MILHRAPSTERIKVASTEESVLCLDTDVRKTIQFSRNLTKKFNSMEGCKVVVFGVVSSPVQLNFLKANKPHIDRLNEHDNFINNVSRQATEKIVRSQDSAVSAKTIKTN